MKQAKQIRQIAIGRLIAHPANPNRMSAVRFGKLILHLKENGNYEPVIVRKHPKKQRYFEILNGHHRTSALRQLGHEAVDCIEWQVDDEQALMLLATMNRLTGVDVPGKKSELVRKLAGRFSVKELASRLVDSRRAIERFKNFKTLRPMPRPAANTKAFLNPLMFFLNDEQQQIVNEAIDLVTAPADSNASNSTRAQKKAIAITELATQYSLWRKTNEQ